MNKFTQYQALYIIFACAWLAACTVQQTRIQYGTIPESFVPTTEEQANGQEIFSHLSEDFPVDNSSTHHDQLDSVFNRLAVAATVNPSDWQIFLLDAPDIVNIRAVQGNYIFVWSGVFDVVEDEDELAGLLACEMAHGLARHNGPVEFNMASELLFGITDVATSVGLIILTQGAVSVSGVGMTRWAYVEATDLDPVDRVYSDEQIEDMAAIALRILEESRYSTDGLLKFWKRAGADNVSEEKVKWLIRKTPPQERVAILEAALVKLPDRHKPGEQGGDVAEKGLYSGGGKNAIQESFDRIDDS